MKEAVTQQLILWQPALKATENLLNMHTPIIITTITLMAIG